MGLGFVIRGYYFSMCESWGILRGLKIICSLPYNGVQIAYQERTFDSLKYGGSVYKSMRRFGNGDKAL